MVQKQKQFQIQNLPEHEHDPAPQENSFLLCEKLILEIQYQRSPKDPTFDVASQQNSQRLLTSGGVLDGGNGDPLDVMNPFLSMKYIIYTGRNA